MDSASAFIERALLSWVLTSPICWFDSVVLLVADEQLDFERKILHPRSASETFLRKLSISPESHWLASLGLILTDICCSTR